MQGTLVSLKILQMMGRKKGALGSRNTLLHSQGKTPDGCEGEQHLGSYKCAICKGK